MQDGLDARDILARLADLAVIAQLLGCYLHAQTKLCLAQIQELLLQLGRIFLSQIFRVHDLPQESRHKRRLDRQLGGSKGEINIL